MFIHNILLYEDNIMDTLSSYSNIIDRGVGIC